MSLFEKHKALLQEAIVALYNRTYYSAYPEHPKSYNDDGLEKAQLWFNGLLNNKFHEVNQPYTDKWVGKEFSPFLSQELNILYPTAEPNDFVSRAKACEKEWRYTSLDYRTGLLIECLERIKNRFFDIAIATQHTSGQAFMMSFQASGPHANDRALESIAMGYDLQTRFPSQVYWEKPMGKFNIKVHKTWKCLGKGISLVIGCSTFPVWNTFPGMFASLITGNVVIVKPHPLAILPIAVAIGEMQDVFAEHGLDVNIVQLASDEVNAPITKQLAEHKDIKLIDYTGSSSFGDYVESIPNKTVFTEKAGVNSIILDSVKDIDSVAQNIAFSASLYSGQMCTAPQNIFIPTSGIEVNGELKSFNEIASIITTSITNIANHPKMGTGILGAIQNINTSQRIGDVQSKGYEVLLESQLVLSEEFPLARTASPIVLTLDASEKDKYAHELFGPIVILIKTKDTDHSIQLAKNLALEKGAISCGAYTTNKDTKIKIATEMEEAFVPVSFNLIGQIFMNQNAAFSDFHVTGGNPSGNASFADQAFLAKRFVWVGHKELVD